MRYENTREQLAYEKGYNAAMERAGEWAKIKARSMGLENLNYVAVLVEELGKMRFKEVGK